MPAPVAHPEDRTAGVWHEDERRNRERGPKERLPPAAHTAQRPVKRCQRAEGTGDARNHESDEARSERLEEERLEVGRERTEPVNDVAIEELAARQRVRVHPLRSGIDDRIRPL